MPILINQLTRMRPGFVCTAGIDLATGRHVRPLVQNVNLGTNLLHRNGGPFDIGLVVDLGLNWHIGRPPEIEDHLFMPLHAKVVRTAGAAELWDWLTRLALTSLNAIFGPDLAPRGAHTCAVDAGKGLVSLGCLRPKQCLNLHVRPRPGKSAQVRVQVRDDTFDLELGVTDIRLYGRDHVSPDDAAIRRVDRRLQSGDEIILCVGLSRAFQPVAGSKAPPLHWLQVNNLHFNDDPIWQLE
jgi:hypothetical protein